MVTLRQRIRKTGIRVNWKHCKGEVRLLPISAQTLFMNRGLPFDTFEQELRSEGWLDNNESLWDGLRYHLYRKLDPDCEEASPWDCGWTEEDFKNYFKRGEECK